MYPWMKAFAFWGWWGCLDWRLRYASAVAVMLLAGLLAPAIRASDPSKSYRAPIVQQPGQPPPPRDYRGPIFVGGIGFIMMMFAGRSKAEKLGYQDF
jgi:hypothetical protein